MNYIGITIGPIGDTMSLTSTPAGLWAASYLFSFLAHEIRIGINKENLLQDNLIYAGERKVSDLFIKGVGLYHDRIIYQADEEHTIAQANKAVGEAVEKIIDGFSKTEICNEEEVEAFFKSFFNIHILSIEVSEGENFEDNSFLIRLNDALDCAELEKSFPSSIIVNPILALFNNTDDKNRNERIKSSFLVSENDSNRKLNWVLTNTSERGIKDLESIANADGKSPYTKKSKASRYYAVIRADGDNMGATIKKIQTEKEYIAFSEKCIKYGCKTAEIVLKYGGIPIYVGGDDLLCITPLMSKVDEDSRTFLDMIQEIRNEFKKVFPGTPDLSFGVQIQFVRAPLYEALNESGRLLFGAAKANKPGALAVNLKKHSGQSAEILIKTIGSGQGEQIVKKISDLILSHFSETKDDGTEQNKRDKDPYNLLEIKDEEEEEKKEKLLKSVGTHIADFAILLDQAALRGDDAIDHYFENVFDNDVPKEQLGYINKICELTKLLNTLVKEIRAKEAQNKVPESEQTKLSDVLGASIRIVKFFSEKIEREEAQ